MYSSCGLLLCMLILGFTREGLTINVQQTKFVRATPGDDVNLDCATADATVSLWHTDAQGIETKLSPSKGNLAQSGSNFTLLGISLRDYGLYKCKVKKGGSETTTKEFHLFYSSLKPLVLIETPMRSIVIGGHAVFTCDATKKPVWSKIEQTPGQGFILRRIPISDRHTVTLLRYDGRSGIFQSALYIKNATRKDEGLYECRITKQRKYARLIVRGSLPAKVQEVSPGQSMQVWEGESKTLDCIVTGFPRPQVIWLKDDTHLTLCDQRKNVGCAGNPRYFTSDKTGLKIKNIHYPEDHGKFVCLARNNAGVDAGVINLDVQVAPKMGVNIGTYVQRNRRPVNIKCNVQYSNPSPTFTWESGLKANGPWNKISFGSSIGIRISQIDPLTSLLYIPENTRLPPRGLYFKCQATNREGSDSAQYELRPVMR